MTAPDVLRCPWCHGELQPDDRYCPRCFESLYPESPSSDTPPPKPTIDSEIAAELRAVIAPRYVLMDVLGSGGMGTVFLAREPELKRHVAVKVMSPALAADVTARARFVREAQAVAGISHPNVVSVYSVGQLPDGTPYFVMQHVSGQSLAGRLALEGPVSVAEGRRLIAQIASALAAAHAKGIIHRDIKPANVLYDEESGRALVTDFGVAAVIPTSEADAPTQLTGQGVVIGTLQYMSPEQLLAAPVTDRTDIYSLGLLAYEILTGGGPHLLGSPKEIMNARLREVPRPLGDLRSEVDVEFESLVTACLAPSPEQRPSAADLAKRLGGVDVILEWPPPDLHSLLGQARRLTRILGPGSLLFVGPLVLLLGSEPQVAGAAAGFATLSLVALCGVGAVLMLRAAWKVVGVGGDVTRAIRAGYGWMTVAEVLADHRGDTGALIAGTREYSALSAEVRGRFREARVRAAVARGLAAAISGPMVLLFIAFAPRGDLASIVLPVVVLLSVLVLALTGAMFSAPEATAVVTRRVIRERRVRRPPSERRLVDAWYESLEAARRGQDVPRGGRGRSILGRVGATALAAIVGVTILLAVPVLVVATLNPVNWSLGLAGNATFQERIRLTEPARRFRLPGDSQITALEAGRAVATLIGVPAGSHLSARTLEGIDSPRWFPSGGGPFAGSLVLRRGDSLIVRAKRGFTAQERNYLGGVAEDSRLRAFGTLGRASRLDLVGGLYQLPLPASFASLRLPNRHISGLRHAAEANIAKAAYLFSIGRLQDAETSIRETMSLGLLLIDESTDALDLLWGSSIVRSGEKALLSFFDATGRSTDARLLRRALDSVATVDIGLGVGGYSSANPYKGDLPRLRHDLGRVAVDSTAYRGLRWDALHTLAYAQCSNIREVIYGPAADLRETFDVARRQLVRYPSEEELFRVIMRASKEFPRERLRAEGGRRFLYGVARISSGLLRNDRLLGCLGPILA